MNEIAPTASDVDMLRRQRILIVGAGAIGQVFGLHLHQAGADVSFFVKDKYVEAAEEGFEIHRYGLTGMRPKSFLQRPVFSDHRLLRMQRFDQIWLCMSSTALRSGFLESFAESITDATWVTFQPGIEDRYYMAQYVPFDRIVSGMVSFIAYQAPLLGEDLWPEGIAYYVPPFSPTLFSGPEPYVSKAVHLLQTGGLPAAMVKAADESARYGSSVLIPLVVALECVNWSWSDLVANKTVLQLVRESVADTQMALQRSMPKADPGYAELATKKWLWPLALRLAPMVASFPLEAYVKHHFTKVRDQTDQMVDEFTQLCRDNALISRSLEALAQQWRGRRHAETLHALPRVDLPQQAEREEETTPMPASGVKPTRLEEQTPMPQAPGREPDITPMPASGVKPTGAMAAIGAASGPIAVPAPDADFDFEGGPTPEPVFDAAPDAIDVDIDIDVPELEFELEPDDEGGQDSTDPMLPKQSRASADADMSRDATAPTLPKQERVAPTKPLLRRPDDLDPTNPLQKQNRRPLPPSPSAGPQLPFEVEEPEAEEPTKDLDIQSREEMATILDPIKSPGEVHFRDNVSAEQSQELQRQDWVQTEFATEESSEDLRAFKAKLRARLSAKKSRSPALRDEEK